MDDKYESNHELYVVTTKSNKNENGKKKTDLYIETKLAFLHEKKIKEITKKRERVKIKIPTRIKQK